MITIILAHPYLAHSKTNHAMIQAVENLPEVQIRSLYDLYPDFHINVAAEQEALKNSDTIVLQHPLYWYHTPALMTLWLEKILTFGWAFGVGGDALKGKRLLWAITTGGDAQCYSAEGYNNFTITEFSRPVQQTALFCQMEWLDPFVTHNAGLITEDELLDASERYRDRLFAEIQYWHSHPKASD